MSIVFLRPSTNPSDTEATDDLPTPVRFHTGDKVRVTDRAAGAEFGATGVVLAQGADVEIDAGIPGHFSSPEFHPTYEVDFKGVGRCKDVWDKWLEPDTG